MPVYTYRRDDGTTFELQQRFSDEPLTVDPTTGQKVIRIVSAPSIIFKGSGFYATDNKKGSSGSTTRSSSDKAEENGKSDAKAQPAATTSEAKSDSKPPVTSAAD